MSEHLIELEEAQNNLLDCAAFLAENIRSRNGYGEAMREIVPRYLQKNAVDLAAQLADAVEDPFVRDRLLIETAAKCAEIGDDEYALQLVESIEEDGLHAQARRRIALEKSERNDFARAFEIAATLDHSDDVLAAIAAHQAAQSGGDAENNMTAALQTVDKIDFADAKVVALQNVALVCLKRGDAEKACELLERAAQAADEIEFPEEKIRALSETANYFIEAGRADFAIETFDRAKTLAETIDRRDSRRDFFLAEIAAGFARAGSLELADRALDAATDKTQISSALLHFAQIFWEKGERSEALEAVEESYQILKSQRDGETRDSRARFALLAAIAAQFARFEKAERAVEIAQSIPIETEQPSVLAQIAQICAAQEKDDLARLAVNAIKDEAQKMSALIDVSDQKKRDGKTAESLKILTEAASLAETVPQFSVRAQVFGELARRFFEADAADKARDLALESLRTIGEIRDETTRAVALAQLSDVHEAANFQLSDAEKAILQTMIRRAER